MGAAVAANAEWARDVEGVGAVYVKDEQYDGFCACSTCNVDSEEVIEVSIPEPTSCDSVCRIETASDSEDDLVTSEYRGLRDVDGWQRKDPWGGSAEVRPKRVNISSTPTLIFTLTSISTFSLRVRPACQRREHSLSLGRCSFH